LCLLLCLSAVSFAAVAQSTPAQQITVIRGTVTGDNAEPLVGVIVTVENTTHGAVTDVNGNFNLRVPANLPAASKIKFSMLGRQAVEEVYGGRERIDVRLKEVFQTIDNVVVTGILNMARPDMVGAHQTIKADDIILPHLTSIDDMLQGVAAGVMVTSPMRAGAAAQITIRGQSTLLGGNSPLWVVDGIIQPDVQLSSGVWDNWVSASGTEMNDIIGSAISWLNPMDIETITILKDASATAIYGSRASNGVIVVTTKRGTADRLSLRADYNVSVGQRLNYGLYNLMNSQERINFSKEAFEAGVFYRNVPFDQMYTYEGMYNMFLRGRITEEQFIRQYNYLETVNTDWFDLLTRPSTVQNFNLNASGGTSKSTYMTSISYSRNNATEIGNDSERFTGRLASGVELSSKIRVDVQIMGSLTRNNGFAGAGIDPIGYATTTSRAIPAYNQDGTLAYYQIRDSYKYNVDTQTFGLPYNIIDDRRNASSRVETPVMQASIDFKWKLLPDLMWQVVGGYTSNARMSETWLGENSFHVISGYRGYHTGSPEATDPDIRAAAILKNGGVLITDQTYARSYNLRNQLNYLRTFNDIHRVTMMAMWEISSMYRNSKYNTVFGYDKNRGERIANPTPPSDMRPIGNNAPSDYFETFLQLQKGFWRSTNFTDNKASFVMIGAYSLRNKYVINANFRNDWSNAFGQNVNRRFNPAWSVGASWKMSQEGFFDAVRGFISAADIRLTYGTQGNISSTQTAEMVLRYDPVHPIFEEPISSISRIANPWMTWERTENWNFGLDLGLFNNGLTLVIDGYTRLSNVGRVFTDTPENGGFQSILTGTFIRNTGMEFTLSATPLRTESWRIGFGANFSKNWSRIVREDTPDATSMNTTSYVAGGMNRVIVPGKPLGAFWAYSYAGPHPEYGIPTFNHITGQPYALGTDMIPTEWLVYAGTRISDITSGMNLRVSYKNFSMNSQFVGILGGKTFLFNPYSTFINGRMPEPDRNLNKELVKRWTKNNTESSIPGLYIVPNENANPLLLTTPDDMVVDRYRMWSLSDARIASLSSLRCRNISITYALSKERGLFSSFMQRANLRTVNISASVNNVFLIADSRWGGMDPDLGGDRKMPRSFSFGVNFGF